MFNNISLTSILIAAFFCSCNKTSTPKEYLYKVEIPKEIYQKDVQNLQERILARFDSIHIVEETKGEYTRKYVETIVDTIFYGPSNKIAFLAVSMGKDKYVADAQPNNPDGIVYNGECFIGVKKDSTNVILKSLKYSVSSSQSYERVLKTLREMYYREMKYIEGRYNINDTRFWDSSVW